MLRNARYLRVLAVLTLLSVFQSTLSLSFAITLDNGYSFDTSNETKELSDAPVIFSNLLTASFSSATRTDKDFRIFNQTVSIGQTVSAELKPSGTDYQIPWCESWDCGNNLVVHEGMSLSRHEILADTLYRIHITGGLSGGSYFTEGYIEVPQGWKILAVTGFAGDQTFSYSSNRVDFRSGLNYGGCVYSDCGRIRGDIFIGKSSVYNSNKSALFASTADPEQYMRRGLSGSYYENVRQWSLRGYNTIPAKINHTQFNTRLLDQFQAIQFNNPSGARGLHVSERDSVEVWINEGGYFFMNNPFNTAATSLPFLEIESIQGQGGGSSGLSWHYFGAPLLLNQIVGPGEFSGTLAVECMDRPVLSNTFDGHIMGYHNGYPVGIYGNYGDGKYAVVFASTWNHDLTYPGNAYRANVYLHGNLDFLRDIISFGYKEDLSPDVENDTEYILSEDFESYSVGTFPSSGGWSIRYNGAGDSHQYVTDQYSKSGNKSLRLRGVQSWDARILNTLSSTPQVVFYEVAFFSESIQNEGSFGLHNPNVSTWGSSKSGVSFRDGFIRSHGRDLLEYDPSIWNKVRVKADFGNNLVSIWINDEPYLTNQYFEFPEFDYTHFHLTAINNGTNTVFYDDIKIWEAPVANYTQSGPFARTIENYSESSDWDTIVKEVIGDGYRVADWNDLVNYFNAGENMSVMMDELGVENQQNIGLLTRNGNPVFSGDRYYFATRHNGNPPGNYLVHADIDNNLISLGSWWGTFPILAYNPNYYENFYLNISASDPIHFGAEAESLTIQISSNLEWSVKTDENWIDLSVLQGSNNGSLTITVLENSSAISRSSALVFTSGEMTFTFTVFQSGMPQQGFSVKPVSQGPFVIDEPYWVEIRIGETSSAQNLYGISLILKTLSESTELIPESLEYGGFLGDEILPFSYKVDDRTIDLTFTKTSGEGVDGSGLLARIQFRSSEEGNVRFSLENIKAYDNNANEIAFQSEELEVFVTVPQLCVWPGDTNNDGLVNAADILPIGMFYNQTSERGVFNQGMQWRCNDRLVWVQETIHDSKRVFADANGDGVINGEDVLAIGLNYSKTRTEAVPKVSESETQDLLSKEVDIRFEEINITNEQISLTLGSGSEVDIYGLFLQIEIRNESGDFKISSAEPSDF